MRKTVVNIPPVSVQNEIVRRVEKLIAFADRLEARYNTSRAQVEKLTPALLAKAFRGELVEQDPTDEPAAVLLERIRAQKESAPAKTRKRTASALPHEQPPVGAASGREPSAIRGRRPLQQQAPAKPAPNENPTAPAGSIPLALIKAMKPGQEYSRADLTTATGITAADWTWAIRQLRESGQVVQVGERRGARYRLKG